MLTISILTSLLLFTPQEFLNLYNYQSQSHKDANMPDTVHTQGRSTYDVYIEIDCDCEELLDAIGLEYNIAEEATDVLDQSVLSMTNEQTIACAVLNHELSEYTTKATIYTPSGDVIIFK